MRNEYSKNQRMAMLLELGLNYGEEFNRALNKKDKEEALRISKLIEYIDELMEDIENRQ